MIIALFSSLMFAQSLDSLLTILESHQKEEQWLEILSGEKNYHLLFFQSGFENDSYFAGRDIGLNQFNINAQVSYSYKQLSATLIAIIYENLIPNWQTTALALNYRLPLKFPVDIDVNYSRYFFHGESDSLAMNYPNAFGLGFSRSAKFWGASADFSLLAGTDGLAPQFMPAIYGNFKLYSWNENNTIVFKPELGFYFGSELSALATAPGNSLAKIPPGNGQGNGQGSGNGSDSDTDSLSTYMSVFGLLNTEISFHVIISLGDIEITGSIVKNIPQSVIAEIAYAPTTMYALSLGYVFSFIGK